MMKETKMTDTYERRIVTAPAWMADFQCLAGDCPETCCQAWNIEVDPAHAERFRALDDPDLQTVMNGLLRSVQVRHPGSGRKETLHRLMLTAHPGERCPLMNAAGGCRLQKKYGASMLCDTCYFHPRCFWQVDGKTYMSACLSCPECARRALLSPGPADLIEFEAEIDPYTEWLETELIPEADARTLMRKRDEMIAEAVRLLRDRRLPLADRMMCVIGSYGSAEPSAGNSEIPDGAGLMELFQQVFAPLSDTGEKPVREAEGFLFSLAGGRDSFSAVLWKNYREGCAILDPFLEANPHLMENFLVHSVFSDGFKQFHRCQNEALSAADILRHEAALLVCWYWLIRTRLAQAALRNGGMDEEHFLKEMIAADRRFWHYPDWFARTADRLTKSGASLRMILQTI